VHFRCFARRWDIWLFCVFFFKQKTAYEISACLVGSGSDLDAGVGGRQGGRREAGIVVDEREGRGMIDMTQWGALRTTVAYAMVPWMTAQTRAEIQFDQLRGFAMAFGVDPQAAVDAAVVTIRREGLTVDEACQHAKRAMVDQMAGGWRP